MFFFFFFFFTEVTFPDAGFNGAENGSLKNHSMNNGSSSDNNTEGRVHKINLALVVRQKGFTTGSVYH